MSATTIERAGLLTGRQMMLLLVIALHALAVGYLMTMRIPLDEKSPSGFKPITAVPTAEPVDPPPPVPAPRLIDSAVTTVLPVVAVPTIGVEVLPSVPVETGITMPSAVDPVDASPGGEGVIESTELQSRAVRSPDDYYPATSIQLQEEGLAVVNVCVGPAGRLEGTPTVKATSGSRRLDAAAVKWATEALAFTPATRNGSAVSACREYRVRFTLR